MSEAQRLRQLEDENQRLKKLVADLRLDKEMLKAVIVVRLGSGAGTARGPPAPPGSSGCGS